MNDTQMVARWILDTARKAYPEPEAGDLKNRQADTLAVFIYREIMSVYDEYETYNGAFTAAAKAMHAAADELRAVAVALEAQVGCGGETEARLGSKEEEGS